MAQDAVETRTTDMSRALYQAAVGTAAQEHYVRCFTAFDARGRAGLGWHWPAFLSTLNWLVYRGLWRWALGFAGLSLLALIVVLGLSRLVFDVAPRELAALLVGIVVAGSVLCGLVAESAYYRLCNRRILAAVAASDSIEQACQQLDTQAGAGGRWPALLLVNAGLALVAAALFGLSASRFDEAPPVAATRLVPTPAVTAASAAAAGPASTAVAAAAAAPVRPAQVASAMEPASAPSPAVPPENESAAPDRSEAVREKPAKAAAPNPETGRAKYAAARVGEEHFAVQIGRFAQLANAQRAQARLEAAGLPTQTDTVKTGTGELARVRAGPFETREQAEKAADKIKALDLPAFVLRIKPTKERPASAAKATVRK